MTNPVPTAGLQRDNLDPEDEDEDELPTPPPRSALRRLSRMFARKLRFVRQSHPTECGAACLAMVLAHFGRDVRLDEIHGVMAIGRDGVSAQRILEAGRWYGLRGRALLIEDVDEGLPCLPIPSLLHWEFNHFVVLARVERNYIYILDPALGRRRVPLDVFKRAFTGVALTLEPTDQFRPAKLVKPRLWSYVRPALIEIGLLPRIIVTSLILQAFGLALPILTGAIVDRVVPRREHGLLLVVSVGLIALVGFSFLTNLLRSRLLLYLRVQLDAKMMLGFLEHLIELPYRFFQLYPAGDLLNRLNSNVQIREILASTAISTVLDAGMVLGYLLLLLVASPPLAALVLLLGGIELLIFLLARARTRELQERAIQTQVASQNYLVQLLSGIETLKTSGTEQRAVDTWTDLFVDELNVSLAGGKLAGTVEATLGAVRLGAPLALLVLGSHQALSGAISLGTMLALVALGNGFLIPLSALVSALADFQRLGTYLERLNHVFESAPEQDRTKVSPPSRLRGGITLGRVSFRHGPTSPLVVQDVSVEIRSGQFVAIVGRSGSGKSTLARLLVGLYRPTSGRVLYDGVDLATLDARSVRSQLGIVTQQPYLFGTTFRRNIALSAQDVPLQDVIRAAKIAAIHRDITEMPMGYETLLTDGGASLSGGQRQRLAIARAVVHQPRILMLDEATSALDGLTEAEVYRNIQRLGCTRVVIAHRLSTIRHADLILVMEDGALVEQGTHAELMAAQGRYAALIEAQLTERDR